MISVNRLEWPPTNRWIELRIRRGKPLREGLCERAFQRTIRCAAQERIPKQKHEGFRAQYAESMVWYRTSFILLYEPPPRPFPLPSTNTSQFRATLAP